MFGGEPCEQEGVRALQWPEKVQESVILAEAGKSGDTGKRKFRIACGWPDRSLVGGSGGDLRWRSEKCIKIKPW